ncbi:hypothetical protein SKAU_G00374180 [Synaphobranchus kaupii]|uniref:Uncharacterized protein n=1 Tax=Synaphobranchus kaupii TaxID=118154 RepID=A0A9Q1EGT1_SYNKA|nr:hypothetical protein SKAU_G00374180 [Synaphobranchus kaupii]
MRQYGDIPNYSWGLGREWGWGGLMQPRPRKRARRAVNELFIWPSLSPPPPPARLGEASSPVPLALGFEAMRKPHGDLGPSFLVAVGRSMVAE